ncbi:MAG: Asp-tRNA(Asn)/Glu-tRNA(Gln) amidotransferase subunit GatC [Halanaerobiaceae bacterium]
MISKEEVRHIADLAHLELTEEDVETFTRQLGDILDYIEKLDELDTGDVVPTSYTIPMRNILRGDDVEESMEREKVLQNAPEVKDGQFRVPPIIGDEE